MSRILNLMKDRVIFLANEIQVKPDLPYDDYEEFEHLAALCGVQTEKFRITLNKFGFKSWRQFAEARAKAITLDDKHKIGSAEIIGQLMGSATAIKIDLVQPNKKEVRISLDEEDFRILVSGKVLIKGNVKIALRDIGWDRMIEIIEKAQALRD